MKSSKKQKRVKVCRACQGAVTKTVQCAPGYCIVAHEQCREELTRQLLTSVGLEIVLTEELMFETFGNPREVQNMLQTQARKIAQAFRVSPDRDINKLIEKIAYLFDLSFLIGTKEGIDLNRCLRSFENEEDELVKASLRDKFHLPVAA